MSQNSSPQNQNTERPRRAPPIPPRPKETSKNFSKLLLIKNLMKDQMLMKKKNLKDSDDENNDNQIVISNDESLPNFQQIQDTERKEDELISQVFGQVPLKMDLDDLSTDFLPTFINTKTEKSTGYKFKFQEPELLENEKAMSLAPKVFYLFPQDVLRTSAIPGHVRLTNYKLYFVPDDLSALNFEPKEAFPQIPLGQIHRIQPFGGIKSRGKFSYGFEIFHKEFRTTKFYLPYQRQNYKSFLDTLSSVAFPGNIENTFAWIHKNEEKIDFGWEIYQIEKEFSRMKLSPQHWQVSYINKNYSLCPSYPKILVFPQGVEEQKLKKIAEFRTKNRLPSLTWKHPINYSTITRSSQPKIGISRSRSEVDENFLSTIGQTNPKNRKLKIIDCRPKANAIGNIAKGGGYEKSENYPNCKLEFLGIDNIHSMRDSLTKLRNLCIQTTSTTENDDKKWFSLLDETNWLHYIQKILFSSIKVADYLESNQSVLIHCSDGWDRSVTGETPLICRNSQNKEIFISRIDELYDHECKWILDEKIHQKETNKPLNNLQVWTENGFSNVNQIIRHFTSEEIVMVSTKTACVNVTTGHSLLNPSGKCVKVENVEVGDQLLHNDPPKLSNLHQFDYIQVFQQNQPIFFSKKIAWFFGLFVASGILDWQNKNISISHQNENVLIQAKLVLQCLIKTNSQKTTQNESNLISLNFIIEKQNDGNFSLSLENQNQEFIQFFKYHFFDKDYNKKIPNFILNTNNDNQKEFLKGFFDSISTQNFKAQLYQLNSRNSVNIFSESQILLSGIFILLRNTRENEMEIGYDEARKKYWISIIEKGKKSIEKENILKSKKIIGKCKGYVYDVSTDNQHFQAGIGRIIVHNTSQVSGLTQLLEDPYYRTLEGFEVLIEKDWIQFGHKFAQRHGYADKKYSDTQRSPIFLQWIDCVYQCLHQLPNAFEFNEVLLLTILEHLFSLRFGTFMFNCDSERDSSNLRKNTYSLWTFVNNNKQLYVNELYKKIDGPIRPSTSMRHLSFWERYYMKHLTPLNIEKKLERIKKIRKTCSDLSEQVELLKQEVQKLSQEETKLKQELINLEEVNEKILKEKPKEKLKEKPKEKLKEKPKDKLKEKPKDKQSKMRNQLIQELTKLQPFQQEKKQK
ncbi:myotubularin-related protein [Anaeramoeba ignava]|uniref:Myotubularin-related protein n=1 Tax=Anaeramoeba ignava TaxID=1746090 RepID=A0A9Q0RG80_ANAIG|nr:myotubularin-related protein [Anaeramoeba ignava]